MNNGILLTENTPSNLLEMHNTDRIETVFANLMQNPNENSFNTTENLPEYKDVANESTNGSRNKFHYNTKVNSTLRIKACIKKISVERTRTLV